MNTVAKDIAIIGYGIAGRVLAYSLLRAGHSVTVFADPDQPPSASYAAQGLSAIKGHIFTRSNLFGWKVEGHFLLRELLQEVSLLCGQNLISEKCVFEPYLSEDEYWQVVRRVFRSHFTALYNVTKDNYPLGANGPAALGFPDDFVYDSRGFLEALHFLNAGNEKFSLRAAKVNRFQQEKTNKVSVETGEKEEFDYLIIAAGAAVNEILASSSYPTPKARKVFGSTVEISTRSDKNFALIRGKHSFVQVNGRGFIGSTSVNMQDKELSKKDGQFVQELVRTFSFHPDCASLNVQDLVRHSGVRLCYDAMLPKIEWLKCTKFKPRIFQVSGLYKNGYQLSPWAAKKFINEMKA